MKTIKLEIKKQDGGYYFPQFDIHVVAKSKDEAKEIIKVGHGLDVDAAIVEINKQQKDAEENGRSNPDSSETK